MVSVSVAKKIIEENTAPLPPQRMRLTEAGGLILAEDIYAAIDIPGFRQSSMDGYALSFADWQQNNQLTIAGVVAAGSSTNTPLLPGTAVRIFTGAAVPPGADTVVMQEKTRVENGHLTITDDRLQSGANLRAAGGELKAGALALSKDSLLSPAALGLLTSIGLSEVLVTPRPSISIIVTGDELQEPGTPLLHGQVYESNSVVLKAALHQIQLHHIEVLRVKDDLQSLTDVLQQAMARTDVIFLTGGISVGDFDFVLQATINNGVQKLFHTVKQRPAKPLYFGKKNNTYVFGLPGNPASGLVAFYEYALPALGIMTKRTYHLQALQVPLNVAFEKPAGLTHFLKGYYDGTTVTVLGAQESYRLSSFAQANCLIQLDETATICAAGETVEIHLLPS